MQLIVSTTAAAGGKAASDLHNKLED